MTQRLNVNISEEDGKRLKVLADAYGATVTDVVRRAIYTEYYLWELREDKWRILAEDSEGQKARELIFMSPTPTR